MYWARRGNGRIPEMRIFKQSHKFFKGFFDGLQSIYFISVVKGEKVVYAHCSELSDILKNDWWHHLLRWVCQRASTLKE
jgi:hypothetical protein